MPVMDGFAATEHIREIEKLTLGSNHAYIVGLTGHSTDFYKDKCFSSGMDEYSKFNIDNVIVTKPLEND